MSNQENTFLAYLGIHSLENGQAYIGGMLVIDERGIPQEFRCTLPVRPTQVQEMLYGSTLRPYLFNELIGVPLVQSLSTRPECYIVESELLLELRKFVSLPTVHLEKYGESLSSSATDLVTRYRLDSTTGDFQSITVKCQRDFRHDYDSIHGKLERAFTQIDLLEPFTRISTAIGILRERDQRFQ